MRRNHVEIGYLCLYQCIPNVKLADHNLVESPLLVVFRGKVQAGGRVGLRVGIYDEYLLLKHSQGCSEVDRCSCLSNSAFLVRYSYYFSHINRFLSQYPAKLQYFFHSIFFICYFC